MEKFKQIIEAYFSKQFVKHDKEIGKQGDKTISVETLQLETKDSGTTLILERELGFRKKGLRVTLTLDNQRGDLFTVYYRRVSLVQELDDDLYIIGKTVDDTLIVLCLDTKGMIQIL
ncbi:MAG: hypothetical protein WCV85_04485 [Patescibacteria group bacterium]|jgi:hypothetical protein